MDRTPDKSLVWTFPTPNTPLLAVAYRDLYLAAEGTAQQKEMLGDPALLPRPWDPATCQDPLLRQEVWDWLEEFVVWFNREYVWDPNAGMIPSCWPQHPHLVHEIAVLADQRRRAGIATTSDLLEDWHRYAVPAFIDRMKDPPEEPVRRQPPQLARPRPPRPPHERSRRTPARLRQRRLWLRSLGGGVFAALRGGLVAAITQDWLQVGVAV